MEDFFSLTLSIYRPYIKRLEPILEKNQLNVARWLILKDIYYHQPTILVDIAKRRFIEKSTTRQVLKIFEEQDLIYVKVDEKDKRHKIIRLTQKGNDLFKETNQHVLDLDASLLDGVSYDEETYEKICAFIKQLLNNTKEG
ncbi:MarR family winged helix-turn-helix transcriptional regulator [Staphylococcus sp. 11261D007BR]